jgi:nitrous oxidase accessory protein NosD
MAATTSSVPEAAPMRASLSVAGATLLASAFAAGTASAGPSHATCAGFIDSLPASVTTPGTWCLRRDVSGSFPQGSAIDVAASGVILDCNGFGLRNTTRHLGTAMEVSGDDNIVRNCDVRGFERGIFIKGLRTVVENNRLSDLGSWAIQSTGKGSRVTGNHIRDVALTGNGAGSAIEAFGIADVSHNFIDGVRPVPTEEGNISSTGIFVQNSGYGQITGNRIRGLKSQGENSYVYGIDSVSTVTATLQITRNHIDGPEFREGWAIRCQGVGGAGDNIVTGYYRWLGTGYGVAATTGCYGLGPTTVGVR